MILFWTPNERFFWNFLWTPNERLFWNFVIAPVLFNLFYVVYEFGMRSSFKCCCIFFHFHLIFYYKSLLFMFECVIKCTIYFFVEVGIFGSGQGQFRE
jgi:hypothetical protein